MTNNSVKKRQQRERLFREQCGRCYWCGVEMVMPLQNPVRHKTHRRDEATIEHLFSRLAPERGRVSGATHVLACWGCNHQRGKLEDAALPIEERRRRAGPYGAPSTERRERDGG